MTPEKRDRLRRAIEDEDANGSGLAPCEKVLECLDALDAALAREARLRKVMQRWLPGALWEVGNDYRRRCVTCGGLVDVGHYDDCLIEATRAALADEGT